MSEPGAPASPSARGGWRRALRLTGLVLQLLLCTSLVIWFAASGETLLLMIALILGLMAVGLAVREVRGRPAPSRRTSKYTSRSSGGGG